MGHEIQPNQAPPANVFRLFNVIEISCYPDGTITRHVPIPCIPASSHPADPSAVLSRDVELDNDFNTWARIYLPPVQTRQQKKLPLIVYFHPGGFVCLDPSIVFIHNLCSGMAMSLPAVVVSVGFRRAPEHRLPAAYDDAVEALRWIQVTEDEWLDQFVDFSDCYLMGTSSGANIAYQAALRVCKGKTADANPKEMKIKGLIMHSPFFGGQERKESELRLFDDTLLPRVLQHKLGAQVSRVGNNEVPEVEGYGDGRGQGPIGGLAEGSGSASGGQGFGGDEVLQLRDSRRGTRRPRQGSHVVRES